MNHDSLRKAKALVEYYDQLAPHVPDLDGWQLARTMAERWATILADEHPDRGQAAHLLNVLEAGKSQHGSGWTDLYLQVKNGMENHAE